MTGALEHNTRQHVKSVKRKARFLDLSFPKLSEIRFPVSSEGKQFRDLSAQKSTIHVLGMSAYIVCKSIYKYICIYRVS